MDLGLCLPSLAPLQSWRDPPIDYVEGHVQNFLQPARPEAEFRRALRGLRATGLKMPAANCFLPPDLKVTGPAVDEKRLVRYARVAFRRAQAAGIRFIIFGSAGARQVPAGWSRAVGFEQYVAALRLLGPLAAQYGVTVLVESLERGECNLVNTLLEGAVAVARAGQPRVRLLVDFFHMLRNDESPDDIVKAGKWIRHAHLAERAERTAPGVRGDDFRPFLRALRQIDYRGRLSLECNLRDLAAEVPAALDALRGQLADSGF